MILVMPMFMVVRFAFSMGVFMIVFFALGMFVLIIMLVVVFFTFFMSVFGFCGFTLSAFFTDNLGVQFHCDAVAHLNRLGAFFVKRLIFLQLAHSLIDLIIFDGRLAIRLPNGAITTQINGRLHGHHKRKFGFW